MDIRDDIVEALRAEIIGPPLIIDKETGSAVVYNENPKTRFIAGVLYPIPIRQTNEESEIDNDSSKVSGTSSGDVENDDRHTEKEKHSSKPSALSFSCCMVPAVIQLKVKYAEYSQSKRKNTDTDYEHKAYIRDGKESLMEITSANFPKDGAFVEYPLSEDPTIVAAIRVHESKLGVGNQRIVTFSLMNKRVVTKDYIAYSDCIYEVNLEVSNQRGFLEYNSVKHEMRSTEEMANQLLYSDFPTYAVGHGCSPVWDVHASSITRIYTDPLPTYEIKPIEATSAAKAKLDIYHMSDLDENSSEYIFTNLKILCEEYKAWIKGKSEDITTMSDEHRQVAAQQASDAELQYQRMIRGLKILETQETILTAFKWMNRVMLLQYLHYACAQSPREDFAKSGEKYPCDDPASGLRIWRPFQIAFILINVEGMSEEDSEETKIADLIWFPTGGGKTEAYLGLSAFTIFCKRLEDPQRVGTEILMRYTLRLLTAEQFERAASMIFACEIVRRENEEVLGINRISIGLWVGAANSPNLHSGSHGSINSYKELIQNSKAKYSFVLRSCPWCGARIGRSRNNPLEIRGIVQSETRVFFSCEEKTCEFHGKELPLLVIDEDIYESPPTLLFGTVDKFAMLTWNTSAGAIFKTPPSLIVQDELHLISGPLGTMVALYESVFYKLCTRNGSVPKIVASTATIARAAEQMHALYNCGEDKVRIFPVQCADFGDSFFAKVNKDAVGRRYVGIYASCANSFITAQVRICARLFQSIKEISGTDQEKDPYWTLLAYFNSLRELGHAKTVMGVDVKERMRYFHRDENPFEEMPQKNKRYLEDYLIKELTSRESGENILVTKEQLRISKGPDRKPIDVCLATNMIAVGLDIQRLGLMTVMGMPRLVSEYIQATSRVGRGEYGGLVFSMFNHFKARDRSFYEQFIDTHSKIYRYVEPTSITPFALPARDRALHAVIVTLARHHDDQKWRDNPKRIIEKCQSILDEIKEYLVSRVTDVDPSEAQATKNQINELLMEWENKNELTIFGSSTGKNGQKTPLLFPYGKTSENLDVLDKSWMTLTSMRNVDKSCKTRQVTNREK